MRLKTLALGGLWRGDADVWLRRNEEWLLPVLALNSQPAKQALALLPHLDECRIHAEEIFAVRSRLSRYGHFCSPNQQAWADARRAAWLKHNDSVLRQLELTTTCREFELLLAQLEDPHE